MDLNDCFSGLYKPESAPQPEIINYYTHNVTHGGDIFAKTTAEITDSCINFYNEVLGQAAGKWGYNFEEITDAFDKIKGCLIYASLDRLYELAVEDSKNNIIVKLCNIGDTVWVVGTKCMSGLYDDECEERCGEFELINDYDECKDCPFDKEFVVFPREVSGYLFNFIHGIEKNDYFVWGKTVFATKEEAERRMEEMDSHG